MFASSSYTGTVSVGTEKTLPVEHIPIIKSVKTYENKISIQFQFSI